MELTKEQIDKINKECPYNQGVFVEPYGVPTHIKEPIIYCRYSTGGYSGGSCWDDSDPQPYSEPMPKDHMKVLDLVLKELKPDISYLDLKMITGLIEDNSNTEYEYYGNSTDWVIEYIKLSELYETLDRLSK